MTISVRSRWQSAAAYLCAKLTAAGAVFIALMVLLAGLDPVALSQLIGQLPFWAIFYGYAVLFSICMDGLMAVWKPKSSLFIRVLLYIVGGYLPFLWFFPQQPFWILFIGLYGVVCALCFYGIDASMRHKWPASAIAALALLGAMGYLTLADHTRVEGWSEQREEAAYSAQFDYFHGQKEVAIQLKQGDTLTYRVAFELREGGHGYRLDGPGGDPIGMEQLEDGGLRMRAEEDKEVRVILTGDRANGTVRVTWEVEPPA
ncbi:hypothetical protein [Paenibacillus sp. 1P07SE]|uniref:hypothetical protein n=1 Tax=Paenibacillus sp. 1P07SE TaxID=3132209 RepID=UPI0039A556F8